MIGWIGHVFKFSEKILSEMPDYKVLYWYDRAEVILKALYPKEK